MKFSERLQYKLRKYMYEINMSKKHRDVSKKTDSDESSKKATGHLMQMIDEMDEYLGELFQNLPHKKDDEWKN